MGSHAYNNTHDELYENSAFSAEMSSKMQVPKRISVLGGKICLIWYSFKIFALRRIYH